MRRALVLALAALALAPATASADVPLGSAEARQYLREQGYERVSPCWRLSRYRQRCPVRYTSGDGVTFVRCTDDAIVRAVGRRHGRLTHDLTGSVQFGGVRDCWRIT